MTSTTSWTPLATAIAPTRKASEPDGQAFSMRVQAMPLSPIAVGTVLPAMPSWPQSVPRWVATKAASTDSGSKPLSTASHAARNAPAAIVSNDWSNSSPNLISPAPTTATRFQLTVLPPHSRVLRRYGAGLPSVHRDAALVGVAPQTSSTSGADLDVVTVADAPAA